MNLMIEMTLRLLNQNTLIRLVRMRLLIILILTEALVRMTELVVKKTKEGIMQGRIARNITKRMVKETIVVHVLITRRWIMFRFNV